MTLRPLARLLAVALAFFLAAGPAAAKGGGPKPKPPKTTGPKTVGGKPSSGAAVKGMKGGSQGKKGGMVQGAKAPKSPSGGAAAAGTKSKSAKAPKSATQSAGTGGAVDQSSGGGGSTEGPSGEQTPGPNGGPGPSTQLSKAQQLLTKNTNLQAKMQSRLPAGTDVIAAAAGFRNLGQFVAAVNVSHNHGLSFDALKAKMTGPSPVSLGQAMQQLKGMDPTTANALASSALASAQAEVGTPATAPR